MEYELNGGRSQWKTTSRKPYRKQMTSACLASRSCTELGPAQPQLFLSFFLSHHHAGYYDPSTGKDLHLFLEFLFHVWILFIAYIFRLFQEFWDTIVWEFEISKCQWFNNSQPLGIRKIVLTGLNDLTYLAAFTSSSISSNQ